METSPRHHRTEPVPRVSGSGLTFSLAERWASSMGCCVHWHSPASFYTGSLTHAKHSFELTLTETYLQRSPAPLTPKPGTDVSLRSLCVSRYPSCSFSPFFPLSGLCFGVLLSDTQSRNPLRLFQPPPDIAYHLSPLASLSNAFASRSSPLSVPHPTLFSPHSLNTGSDP